MRKDDFLFARVDSHPTVTEALLPHGFRPNHSDTQPLGISREATRSIWTTRPRTKHRGQFLFHMSLPQDAVTAANACRLG